MSKDAKDQGFAAPLGGFRGNPDHEAIPADDRPDSPNLFKSGPKAKVPGVDLPAEPYPASKGPSANG